MAQMVVVYKTPKDPEAFTRHYFEVHVPMAKQLPGLRSFETSTGPIVSLAGASDTFFVATLRFDSLDDIKAAFASDAGRACAADRLNLAEDENDLQIFLFDSQPT